MATVVKKGLVSPLGRGDSVAISISSSSGAMAVPEALAPVWERLATMGEYGEGPSYRSDPMRVVAAGGEACWLVVLDPKGLSRSEAESVPKMIADALDAASIGDAIVSRQESAQRFYEEVPRHSVMVVFTTPPESVMKRRKFKQEVAPVLAGLLKEFTDEAAPAVHVGGAMIDVSWDFVEAIGGGILAPDSSRCLVGARDVDGAGVWGSHTTLSANHLMLAGEVLTEPARLQSLGNDLRSSLRALPVCPAATVVTLASHTFEGVRAKLNTKTTGDAFVGKRDWYTDRFLPALGWSTTMTRPLWELVRPSVEGSIAEIHKLADGRVEVTFGTIDEWAPWMQGRAGSTFDAARAALAPILTTDAAYRAFEAEHGAPAEYASMQ